MTIKELFAKYNNPVAIGRGGQKIVYKAITNDGTAYALKIVSNSDDQRSIQEIRIVQSLALDNIPKIIDSGKVFDEDISEEKIYVVEEFVDGETLREILNKGITFSLKRACGLLEVLLNIEVILEQHKIIHRDIKPENIMISKDKVYLLDFGIAKVIGGDSYTRATDIHGPHTPGYAPHELVNNIKLDQDARVDLFAIGVTIYETCTGHNPFRVAGRGIPDLVNNLTMTYMPKSLSLEGDDNGMFSQFIDMLMAKNASERPASAKDALRYFTAVRATLRLE